MTTSDRTELAMPRGHTRVPALDGVRGFAVLWVMFYHFLHGADHHAWLLHGIFAFIHFGYWGVDVFFVLSGFLITGILFDSKSADNYFGSFYARRALRILPLYYAVLVGVFLIAPWFVTLSGAQKAMWHQQGWMWLYCGNLAMVFKNAPVFDAGGIKLLHLWSLAIEEQFYLVWPAIVLICSRRRLVQVCAGLVVVAAASRVLLEHLGVDSQYASYFTLCRVDGLALGAMIAMLARGPRGLTPWLRPARWLAALCAVALGMVLFIQSREIGGEFIHEAVSLVRYGLFACVMIVIVGQPASIVGRTFSIGWLRTFGKYSYALYVFHYMLLPVFNRYFPEAKLSGMFHSFAIGMLVRIILCTAVSFAVSMASWYLFESHFLKLKPFFTARSRRPVEPAAPQPTSQLEPQSALGDDVDDLPASLTL